ncbi:MAG: hypothetical protein JW783_05740 [Bacteroidales bacterium]|nr:hypothetical protein [Bacteroidales bacterium]MBN2749359.1 hypothetical protein [Bacteroidales bacterium]
MTSLGERVTFSSPDENARAGETAPKFQYQPTLATPLIELNPYGIALFKNSTNLFSHNPL